MKKIMVLAAACTVMGMAGIRAEAGGAAVMTREKQQALSPSQALEKLKAGNKRFVSGERLHRDYTKKVALTAPGQYPFASIVGCIDSRVPTELVFDQGLGDIFNARVAGPVLNEDILGSLEFSCKVAGSRLIVILAHTECGAVKGAISDVKMGNLTELLGKIQPAIPEVPASVTPRDAKNAAFVTAVARKNAARIAGSIRQRSPILAEMEKKGEIAIVAGIYDVGTGKVEFFE